MGRAGATALAMVAVLTGGWGAALAADPVDAPVSTAASADTPFARGAAEATPVAAALRAPAALAPTPGDATDRQIAGWIADQRTDVQATGPAPSGESFTDVGAGEGPGAAEPRRIHGEVSVGVGSRGYREASGAVSLPVGQGSEVDLAVADAHADFRHGGSVEQRSIALGVFVDGRDVSRALGRDKCSVPRWGVSEKDDPVVNADGSCAPRPTSAR